MTISTIGMYQFSQSCRPLACTWTEISPSPAQIRKTAAQTAVSTRLIRLKAAVCHTAGGACCFA
jgi:hypothetical protein